MSVRLGACMSKAIIFENVDNDLREADAMHAAAQIAAALSARPDIAVRALLYALDMLGVAQSVEQLRVPATLN